MIVPHHDFSAKLPDDWWSAAGMPGFVRSTAAYRADEGKLEGKRLCIIGIADIAPVRRAPGVEIFRDRESAVNILRGFVDGAALPPIELLKTPNGLHGFRLTNGVHRLYCSLAAGFTHIPAVRGLDLALFDRNRDEHDQELC